LAAVRTRTCGWGCAGRAVLADGWRMRGADTQTGCGRWASSARVRLRGMSGTSARAAARAGAVRDRGGVGGGLRVRWYWQDVVGRGWQRRERAGRRPLGRSAAVGSACDFGVWVCVAGWRCGACAGGGTGRWSATWRAMRARRRAAAVGSWLVVCAACTRPLADVLCCWAISRGRACLMRGRGDARRDAPWLL
jgi:hypothetical protein